ncbi:pre-mRNA-splicing regulator WTAP-like [Coregonus clupeaformis]|uniref:pre-mRNA-splicing regulator WTAP-like n=1 Tax=Coregonus clupeaformis TaxID=59861 RepID=UPI001E1C8DEF|nr:pre-mRNA-splicing regulator WTAP-like [Coregonus clupeaformis]
MKPMSRSWKLSSPKYADLNWNNVTGLKESEEKLKLQQQEASRRGNILVMRLATKEQEISQVQQPSAAAKSNSPVQQPSPAAQCSSQVQQPSAAAKSNSPVQQPSPAAQCSSQVQQPSAAGSSMVDPAINLFFLKMKGELEQTKDKLEQAQNELSAWKFTPDSQTGKKLMAKCGMLIQENQELGRQLSQGHLSPSWRQRKYSEKLKSSQDELNDFIIQLDEEVEGMKSTILVLQQQLRETRLQISQNPAQGDPSAALPEPSSGRPVCSSPRTQLREIRKDCERVSNGPSNGSSSSQRGAAATPSLYREVSSTEEDFPPSPMVSSPGEGETKLSNHSEAAGDQTSDGAGGFGSQLSTGYESVDSPTGSEMSLTQHSNDTDSNTDPHEEKAVPVVKFYMYFIITRMSVFLYETQTKTMNT